VLACELVCGSAANKSPSWPKLFAPPTNFLKVFCGRNRQAAQHEASKISVQDLVCDQDTEKMMMKKTQIYFQQQKLVLPHQQSK